MGMVVMYLIMLLLEKLLMMKLKYLIEFIMVLTGDIILINMLILRVTLMQLEENFIYLMSIAVIRNQIKKLILS